MLKLVKIVESDNASLQVHAKNFWKSCKFKRNKRVQAYYSPSFVEIELPELSENFWKDCSEWVCMTTLKWRWGLMEYFFQNVENSKETSRSEVSSYKISSKKNRRNIRKNFWKLHENSEKSLWTPYVILSWLKFRFLLTKILECGKTVIIAHWNPVCLIMLLHLNIFEIKN